MSGKWYVGTRGTHPRSWEKWCWREVDAASPFLDLGNVFKWAQQGQHVCLEFVPDGIALPDDGR